MSQKKTGAVQRADHGRAVEAAEGGGGRPGWRRAVAAAQQTARHGATPCQHYRRDVREVFAAIGENPTR